MKTKLLAGILVAGAMAVAAPAGATVFYSDTLAGWFGKGAAGVTDGDTDSNWALTSLGNITAAQAALITVNIDEVEDAFGDTYTINYSFIGLAGGALTASDLNLTYVASIIPPNPEFWLNVKLDTDGGRDNYGATKHVVPDVGSVVDLSSSNGVPDGFKSFGNTPVTLTVTEHFIADATGQLKSTTNVYSVTKIPEPTTLALLGLGLIGLAASRRRQS